MSFSVADLKEALKSLHDAGNSACDALDAEYEKIDSWLDDMKDAVRRGDLNRIHQVAKTPGRKRGALGTINETVSNSSQLDSQSEQETLKKQPKKESRRFQAKRKQKRSSDEEPDSENDSLSKRHRGTITKDSIPESVIEINDTTVTETTNTSSEGSGTQRLTRTMVKRTTYVKESRETIVMEKASSPRPPVLRSPGAAPALRSPSPVDLVSPERVHKFKAPPQLKPHAVPVPELKVCPPQDDGPMPVPPTRMTRTKTRALAKASQKEPPKTPPSNKSVDRDSDHEPEPEAAPAPSRLQPPSFTKHKFGTPVGKTHFLSHSQLLGTPLGGSSSNIVTGIQSFITKPAPASVKKDRQEDYLQKIAQKTNDASKKREELIKAQTEEKIKKRQEKVLKVNAAREAIEKERTEKLRQQMALEEEKRRKLAQQRAAEAAEAAKAAKRQQEEEQRRLAEEKKREEERRAAEEKRKEQELLRQAEERKKEEERRRMAEERKRQMEEKKRKAMEAELRKKEAEKAAAAAAAAAAKSQLNETFVKPMDETFVVPSSSYDMTPMPEDRKPAPAKSIEDYGIEDAGCDDSSDDESNPKKEIPSWAQGKNRMPRLLSQYHVRHRQQGIFFGSKKTTPDLSKMFAKIDRRMLVRKSSAVWHTPPVKFLNDSVF